MGKGDYRSKKGKIVRGSNGNSRPKAAKERKLKAEQAARNKAKSDS